MEHILKVSKGFWDAVQAITVPFAVWLTFEMVYQSLMNSLNKKEIGL